MVKGTKTNNVCEGDECKEMESSADTWKRAQSNVRLMNILTKDLNKIRIAKQRQFLERDIHHEDFEFSCDEDEEDSSIGEDSEDDEGEDSEDCDDEYREADKKTNPISGPLGLLHLMLKKTARIEVLPAKQNKTRTAS